jgi:hypothetical protein
MRIRYSDFMNYDSGVYIPDTTSGLLGGHCVKIVGWGEDVGTSGGGTVLFANRMNYEFVDPNVLGANINHDVRLRDAPCRCSVLDSRQLVGRYMG